MKIYIEGHNIEQPVFEIVRAMTGEKADITDKKEEADVISTFAENSVFTEIIHNGKSFIDKREITFFDGRDEKQALTDTLKKSYYETAVKIYGKKLPWGFMTGIRPTSIAKNYSDPAKLSRDFLVDEDKARLAVEVKNNTLTADSDSLGVYIGIPFCPTRCLYCSFVSLPMNKQKQYVQPYVDCLCEEIKYTGRKIRESGRKVNSVYIGGGTPTSVSEPQLEQIIEAVKLYIPDYFNEFTVEAGRPDTVTREKLRIMKEGGVTRISINPQTLNDEVLKKIGRCHDEKMFLEAFEMSRDAGFDNINTDVIAGLPGETYEMFRNSMEKLIKLEPESVTVHTMCVKRAATLTKEDVSTSHAADMVAFSHKILKDTGYIPYYMYRQKDSIDNLENTGYCKKGFESVYNVFMMEDQGSVVGIGAGSSSKAVFHDTHRIERVFNLKDAHEYIKSFETIINRKDKYFDILPK